jgi:hypothetical protein
MTTEQGVLDVQVRVLEQALHSPEYRFNSLARAVFEARLVTLRLAMFANQMPATQHPPVGARPAARARP